MPKIDVPQNIIDTIQSFINAICTDKPLIFEKDGLESRLKFKQKDKVDIGDFAFGHFDKLHKVVDSDILESTNNDTALLPCFYNEIDINNAKSHAFGYFGYSDYVIIESNIKKDMDISRIAITSLQYAISTLLGLRDICPISVVVILHELDSKMDLLKEHISQSKYAKRKQIRHFHANSCMDTNSKLKHILNTALILLDERGQHLEGKYCTISNLNKKSIALIQNLYKLNAFPIAINDKSNCLLDVRGLKADMLGSEAYKKECEILESSKLSLIPTYAYFLIDSNISTSSIKNLLKNGCKCVVEISPILDSNAARMLIDSMICYIPFMLSFAMVLHAIECETNNMELDSIEYLTSLTNHLLSSYNTDFPVFLMPNIIFSSLASHIDAGTM